MDFSLSAFEKIVVAGSPANIAEISAALASISSDVLVAQTGTEALELLLANDVALAIVDVGLSDMDGFELTEKLRAGEQTRRVAIILVISGPPEQNCIIQGYQAGAVDVLFTPLDPLVLQAKVKSLVERGRQQRVLTEQADELTRALRYNELFVAVLGHDLKSPIGVMVMSADFIAGRSEEARIKRAAERIKNVGSRVSRMIDDLLDLSRIRHLGDLTLMPGPVELGDLAERIVAEYGSANPGRTIDLRREGDLRGDWDEVRLAQVLSNLIGNALTHGVEHEPVTLGLSGAARQAVVLTVHNVGEIPQEVLSHLFDPFRFGSGKGSLGLGLWIVQQVVAAHRGTVEVESSSRTGTCFKIQLPRRGPTERPET